MSYIYIMIISTPLYVGVMTHVLYIYHDYFYPTLCSSNDPCLTYTLYIMIISTPLYVRVMTHVLHN